MKITTTKQSLFNALNETNRVIPIRTTLPILSCVLVRAFENKIILIATDLEQTILSTLDGSVLEEGETAVPSGRFLEIIAALPNEEIALNVKEDQEIEINSSKGIYKIMGKDSGEFPETPKTEKKQELVLKGKELLNIIQNTLYATSKDDLKPALCGVCLNITEDKIIAVSTDGHRLVKFKKTTTNKNPEGSIIVPGKFFSILKNGINPNSTIKINISENHLDVKEGKNKTITRVIKENFPDFNSVIPEELNIKAKINTEETIAGIKRVSIFSNKTTKQVLFSFNKNELIISTEDQETRSSAKEHLKCEYQNENITIAYNAQYLKEVIQHIKGEEIEIFLSGPLTAAVFKPTTQQEGTELTALLMPLRTKN